MNPVYKFTICLWILSILTISCNNPVNQSSNIDQVLLNRSSFSTDDYIKGIAFMDGDVANLIPAYSEMLEYFPSLSEEQAAVKDSFVNAVILDISINHSDFYNSFKDNILSGDLFVIRSSLIELNKILYEFIPNGIDFSSIDFNSVDEILGEDGKINENEVNEVYNQLLDDNIFENDVLSFGLVFAVAVLLVAGVFVWIGAFTHQIAAASSKITFPDSANYPLVGTNSDLILDNFVLEISNAL